MTFDYIVIGAGSAGSALAGRLSEDGRDRVLVLEAGGSDKRLAVLMPAASFMIAITNPRYDWRYTAEADPTRGGRRDYMPRGKVLGGTSSINATSCVRGRPEDYDGWAALGCRGWDFESVLPYFKRAEDNENGADAYHGTGGPLAVSNAPTRHPLAHAFLESCVNAGMRRMTDINTPPQDGVGYVPVTQRRGWRYSASRAYLWPAMRRRNVAVLTHAHVRRVLFDGRRAVGVDYAHRGRTARATAAKGRHPLSAGVIASPQLLMLSGPGATPVAQVSGFREAGGERSTVRSTVQYLFSPAGYDLSADGPTLFDRPAVTGLTNLHRPCSRGWIRLNSADPFDPPAIQPNLLDDERDVEALLVGAKFQRAIFATEPIASAIIGEHRPGKDVQSDDDWRAYIREQAGGIYHQAGTCKMGHDPMAVVDDALKVRGIEGLYVADASIMPRVVGANLNATCIMIGEKASDLIKAAHA